MMFYVINGVVMFLALVGMIVCLKKQAELAPAKPLGIVLLVVVIGCGLAVINRFSSSKQQTVEQLVSLEESYQRVADEQLGRWLAERHAGTSVLVIMPEKNPTAAMQARVAAFKAGLKGSLGIEDLVAIEVEDSTGSLSPMEQMAARHFDALLERYPYCTMVVSFIGLPSDFAKMKAWELKPDRRPRFILPLDAPIPGDLRKMLAQLEVLAAVVRRPDAIIDRTPVPEDLQMAFDRRFLLISAENVQELDARYPGRLFPSQ